MTGIAGRIALFCGAIKLSHSVFALPFAVASAFLAADGLPELAVLGKIVLACVLARTSAMAFNRWADAEIDRENPRTRARPVASGRLSRGSMLVAAAGSSAAFVAVTAWINSLAFALSPVALAVVLGYSYTKRFTSLSHVVLGAALGISPLGAWIAVRGELAVLPVLLGLAVLFWTGGFDVIYACQDRDFDRSFGLWSLPRRLGIRGALRAARAFHALTLALLAAVGAVGGLGLPYAGGVAGVGGLLAWEHALVRPDDLSRVGVAFFTANGLVSLFFMSAVILQVVS